MLNSFETMRSLESLGRKLRKAFRNNGNDETIALQDRYVGALDHVAEFLNRVGIHEHIAGKFEELAHAMWALRYGTVAKSVRPAKVGGRGPDGVKVWFLRGDVAHRFGMHTEIAENEEAGGRRICCEEFPDF
jgi:hypothetical protein